MKKALDFYGIRNFTIMSTRNATGRCPEPVESTLHPRTLYKATYANHVRCVSVTTTGRIIGSWKEIIQIWTVANTLNVPLTLNVSKSFDHINI
jgi:hypothetical protein